MNALDLLDEYSSSEEENFELSTNNSRLPTPQLPSFGTMQSVNRTPTDDPCRHQNRLRSFPHEPGNWATYVAVPLQSCCQISSYSQDLVDAFADSNFKPVDDIHLSLSRVVVLRHHWIEEFIQSVRLIVSTIKPFTLSLNGLSVYTNDDKSRTFVALNVIEGCDILNGLVDDIDEILKEYTLPKFYENRSFHVSVLWTLGNKKDIIERLIQKSEITKLSSSFFIRVENLVCKSGNKLFTLPLCNNKLK